ncbi:Niemann-Pick C1 protein-like protein, partial [Tanacetum coccineum]
MESLSIPKSGHYGTIPDSIGCLSFLRTIEFFRNRIYGPIPFSIRLFVGNLFQLWAQFTPDDGAGGLYSSESIWSLGIIVLVLVMILVDLLGVMAILDIQLNVVSVVNLVMLVGIAIEFCVHITHAFLVYYFQMYLALVLLGFLHGLVFLP